MKVGRRNMFLSDVTYELPSCPGLTCRRENDVSVAELFDLQSLIPTPFAASLVLTRLHLTEVLGSRHPWSGRLLGNYWLTRLRLLTDTLGQMMLSDCELQGGGSAAVLAGLGCIPGRAGRLHAEGLRSSDWLPKWVWLFCCLFIYQKWGEAVSFKEYSRH